MKKTILDDPKAKWYTDNDLASNPDEPITIEELCDALQDDAIERKIEGMVRLRRQIEREENLENNSTLTILEQYFQVRPDMSDFKDLWMLRDLDETSFLVLRIVLRNCLASMYKAPPSSSSRVPLRTFAFFILQKQFDDMVSKLPKMTRSPQATSSIMNMLRAIILRVPTVAQVMCSQYKQELHAMLKVLEKLQTKFDLSKKEYKVASSSMISLCVALTNVSPTEHLMDLFEIPSLVSVALFDPSKHSVQTNIDTLDGFKKTILRKDIPKNMKTQIFKEHILIQLSQFFNIHNNSVEQHTLECFKALFCDRQGITYSDNPAILIHERLRNSHVITFVMRHLDIKNFAHSQLICSICKSNQELVIPLLPKIKLPEDETQDLRLQQLHTLRLTADMLRMPLPPLFRGMYIGTRSAPRRQESRILDALFPPNLSTAFLRKILSQTSSDRLVTFVVIEVLEYAFQRLNRLLRQIDSYAYESFLNLEEGAEWEKLRQEVKKQFMNKVPPVSVVLKYWNQTRGDHSATFLRSRVMGLMKAYHAYIPEGFKQMRVSLIRFIPDSPSELSPLELYNLFDMILSTGGLIVWRSAYVKFPTVFAVYMSNTAPVLRHTARRLLQQMLRYTGFFDFNVDEIDIWIDALRTSPQMINFMRSNVAAVNMKKTTIHRFNVQMLPELAKGDHPLSPVLFHAIDNFVRIKVKEHKDDSTKTIESEFFIVRVLITAFYGCISHLNIETSSFLQHLISKLERYRGFFCGFDSILGYLESIIPSTNAQVGSSESINRQDEQPIRQTFSYYTFSQILEKSSSVSCISSKSAEILGYLATCFTKSVYAAFSKIVPALNSSSVGLKPLIQWLYSTPYFPLLSDRNIAPLLNISFPSDFQSSSLSPSSSSSPSFIDSPEKMSSISWLLILFNAMPVDLILLHASSSRNLNKSLQNASTEFQNNQNKTSIPPLVQGFILHKIQSTHEMELQLI